MAGLKFRGSTITCPIRGTYCGASFFQKSAAGSSGMASVTDPTVTRVAYVGRSGPRDMM
jgi:hypothetical protein